MNLFKELKKTATIRLAYDIFASKNSCHYYTISQDDVTMWLLTSLESIEQKFLEPGHTEMDVTSMHMATDSVCINKTFSVSGWCFCSWHVFRAGNWTGRYFWFAQVVTVSWHNNTKYDIQSGPQKTVPL